MSFLKTTAIEKERATELANANAKITEELTSLQSQYTQAVAQLGTLRSQVDALQESTALLTAAQEQLAIARSAVTEGGLHILSLLLLRNNMIHINSR